MTGNLNLHQKVSSRSSVDARLTFLADPDALSVINACRNRNLDLLAAAGVSGSMSVGTLITDDLSGAAAVRTGLYVSNGSEDGLLGISNLSGSLTFRTGLR